MNKSLRLSSKIVPFCFFLILCGSLTAGNIRGTVSDRNTGETLVGAHVLIQGTLLGAASDFDGNFLIKNIQPGSYNLVTNYISYETLILKIEVKDTTETVIRIELSPVTVDVGEVKVTARRRMGSENALITNIRSSNVILSGVSAQLISKSQDKDAAEVIRRVPGITINNGRFVVVRGLTERYNSVMMNNATAPSFEADKRAFSFDAIPSGLIDNILIYKSPAPELPADFAGAAINIQTKNIADQNSFSISYGAKYVENTTFNRDFLTHEGSKSDWTGRDNGSRTIPEGVPAPAEFADLYTWTDARSYLQKTEKLNSIALLFPNNWNINSTAPFADQTFSATLLRRFTIGKISVGSITSLNYGTSFSNTINQRVEFQNYDETLQQLIRNFDFTDQQSKKEYKTGLIQNFNIIYGNNQKLEFRNFINQMGLSTTTLRNGFNYYNVENLRMVDLRYESRFVYSGQLAGEQIFNGERTKINWMLGYGNTAKNQPDNRRLTFVRVDDPSNPNHQKYYLRLQNVPNPYLGGRLWIDMNENIQDVKIDFSHLFNPGKSESSWQIKGGGFYEVKERALKSRLLGVVAVSNPPDIFFKPVSDIMAKENFWFDRTAPYNQHGLSYRDNTRAKDSYDATDKLTAGYLALSIPLTKKLNFYGGVRLENWNREITNFFENSESADKTPIKRDTLDIFPSMNLTWNLNDKNLLRLSFGKTVNRPEFREMAPFDYQDFELFAIVYGNSDLKSAYINNYDFRYEWYPSQGETVSLAGFYKDFTNPIETFLRPSGTTYDYFPYNTEKAFSTGIEIDIRKRFDEFENSPGLLRILKNFTVVCNASLIRSRINTSKQEFTRDTLRVMAGQSPYIANLALFYNHPEKKWDMNLSYNIVGDRIAFVGTPTNPHTWELPRNVLDLTVQKGFGEHIQVKAGIKDILNEPVRFAQYHGIKEDITGYTRYYSPNRQFSFSITWSL